MGPPRRQVARVRADSLHGVGRRLRGACQRALHVARQTSRQLALGRNADVLPRDGIAVPAILDRRPRGRIRYRRGALLSAGPQRKRRQLGRRGGVARGDGCLGDNRALTRGGCRQCLLSGRRTVRFVVPEE